MASSAHMWVHCSQCMSLGSGSTSRLHITSCGRVVCHSCIPSLGAVNCPTCRGPCTRTTPLNTKAPPNILNLFKDVSGQLKQVSKALDWQEQHKRELIIHTEETVMKLMKEEEQQLRQLAGSTKVLEDRRRELQELVLEETALRVELASVIGPGQQHQGSSSRLQQTSLSPQLDQMSSSRFQLDQGSSSRFQLDQGSSSRFQLDQGSSSRFQLDQGSSNKFQLDQRSSSRFQLDQGSSNKFQLDQGSSSSVKLDQRSSSRFQLAKISSSSLQRDQANPNTLSLGRREVGSGGKEMQGGLARSKSGGQVTRRRES